MIRQTALVNEKSRKGYIKKSHRNRVLYLMMLPGIVLFFLFDYLPIFGLTLAFKNFNFTDGILHSPWAGFENFKFFLYSQEGWRAIYNTLLLNFTFICIHTVLQIVLALMLNDIPGKHFRKITQSILFIPFFVSWIVVSVFVYNIFNYEHGAINNFLLGLSLKPVDLYSNAGIWPFILTLIDSWKWAGFGMIIYLAALASIDGEYYSAAEIDGASKVQQIFYISIPLLTPTIITLTLLALGKILFADFGMFYGIIGDNSILFSTSDVIDTFVYRNLRTLGDIGMASAAGFFQSIVGFLLVFFSNYFARKIEPGSALF